MINANELRIGNIINYTGNSSYGEYGIATIKSIEYNGCNGWQDMGASGKMEYKDINGVPITERWLLKFGFEFDSIAWVYGELIIDKGDTGYTVFIHGLHYGKTTNILYVHQLQNLFFALTGTELTIKELVK